jgi:hypothetical protein
VKQKLVKYEGKNEADGDESGGSSDIECSEV